MCRVAGNEHALRVIALGHQQVLAPRIVGDEFVVHRHAHGLFEELAHFVLALAARMQRPVLAIILHDQEGRLLVGHVIVAAAPGAVAHRQLVGQFLAVEQRLPHRHDVGLALQANAELAAHQAVAAIAARQIGAADRFLAVLPAQHRGHAIRILLETQELGAEAHGHARQFLGHLLHQRLKRVLRNQLVGFQRLGTIGCGADIGARLVHRGIGQAHQRRAHQVEHHIHVHRPVAAQPGCTDAVGHAQAAEHFHGARIASLHLRQEGRLRLLLHDRGANAPLAEIDGEREAHRTGADNQNLRGFHGCLPCVWLPA